MSSTEDILPTGYIYVIKVGHAYKIGKTRNPLQRIKNYVTENPNEVEIILIVKMANHDQAETTLHEMFAESRIHGEWFNLDRDDLRSIANMVKWLIGVW